MGERQYGEKAEAETQNAIWTQSEAPDDKIFAVSASVGGKSSFERNSILPLNNRFYHHF
jgi:hypothetical protein